MNNRVEIVMPTQDAWAAYREVRLRALLEEPQAFGQPYAVARGFPEAYWRERLRDVAEGERWLFCARADGHVVGMVGASRTNEDRARGAATVYGTYIEAAARGQGIGRALLAALLDRLAADGVLIARLAVNQEQRAAVGLYEGAGFRIVGEGVVTLGDGLPHPELTMEKSLA